MPIKFCKKKNEKNINSKFKNLIPELIVVTESIKIKRECPQETYDLVEIISP